MRRRTICLLLGSILCALALAIPALAEEQDAESVAWLYMDGLQKGFGGYSIPVEGDGAQAAGAAEMQIITEREDVELAQGTLTVYNAADDTVFDQVSVDRMRKQPIEESEYDFDFYGGGARFRIFLNRALEPNQSYYVAVSEGLLVVPDTAFRLKQLTKEDGWDMITYGYGIVHDSLGFEHTVFVPMGTARVIAFQLTDEVHSVAILPITGQVEVTPQVVTESGVVSISYDGAGKVELFIIFYGAGDEVLSAFVDSVVVSQSA